MIKNYNSLSWRSEMSLNNLKEKVVGKDPTQSIQRKKNPWLKTFLLSLLFMTGSSSFAQTYCTPVATYGCSNGATIGSVITTSAVTNINNSSTGCTSITAASFNNYTSTIQMAASQATSFNISVGITTYGGGVKVWIDYNQNGTFDSNELASESASTIPTGGTHTGIINIPLTATLGVTRMRVRVAESTTSFTSCDSQNYGETEDYAINIITPPSCIPPSMLSTSALTTTSVTLNWTASSTNPTSGYDIYYSTSSTPPTAATVPTVNNHAASPYLATGLTAATTYYWWVRSDCTSETSLWSSGGSFYTSYCVPVGSINYYLANVTTTGGVTNFNNTTTASVGGYGNYSASISVSNFIPTPTTITLTSSSQYDSYFCWIDWNNDLDFNDVNETIFITNTYVANHTGTINIPTGTPLGNYRMRVANSASGPSTSCGSSLYSEYEDYTFTVLVQPTCVAPTALALNSLTNSSVNLTWTASTTTPTNGYDIYYSTSNVAPTAATVPTVNNHPASPYAATGLSTSTTYYWWIRSDCSASDQSAWASGGMFSTTQVPATIPFTDDFSTSQWTASNGTQDNKWFIGAAAGNPANGLYISNDNGVSNVYSNITSVTHAYRDITFPAGLNPFSLSFDWKGFAESCCDYLRVWMVPSTAIFTPGTQITAANTPGAIQLGGNLNQQQVWNTVNYVLPAATYAGTGKRLVFEWRNDGSVNYAPPAAVDNIMMTVITCPAPTAFTASAITTTTANLSWTENGSATDWEIQYGLGTFSPNTGPSTATSTNPYALTNLLPSSTYRVYVRSRCSATDSSLWAGPLFVTTNCAPITSLPWNEGFENLATVGTVFPPCWLNENPGVWTSTSDPVSTLTSGPLTGSKYLRVRYIANATMWTPEFDLVAGETYEFSFNWGGDGYAAWDGGVYVNGSQTFTGSTLLGAKFVEVGDPTTLAYRPETYCFTPTTSGVFTFGIKVIETGGNWYMSLDDFKLKQVVTVPGIDGSLSACQTGPAVDLNAVVTTTVTDGTWNFNLNPNAVDTMGMFNAASVPAGVHQFYYISKGCAPDTTIATVTVVEPSSAGSDGSIVVCRNQPLNLLQGLNGTVDFGGVWIDPNAVVVPNGNTIASNIPGQYNFRYTVSNGVCPADTAKVVVTVKGTCDYLGLDDVAFEAFNMYPNPTSDVLFITNTGSTEVFNYEVLDMNGRVILKENDAINGSTTTELNLGKVEIGVYLIRVFNDQSEKTFRVVKN